MLESSTLYLLLAMGGFVCVAVVLIHRHNSSEAIQKKENEVEYISNQLEGKIEEMEKEVVDLQMHIDDLDDQIDSLKTQEE